MKWTLSFSPLAAARPAASARSSGSMPSTRWPRRASSIVDFPSPQHSTSTRERGSRARKRSRPSAWALGETVCRRTNRILYKRRARSLSLRRGAGQDRLRDVVQDQGGSALEGGVDGRVAEAGPQLRDGGFRAGLHVDGRGRVGEDEADPIQRAVVAAGLEADERKPGDGSRHVRQAADLEGELERVRVGAPGLLEVAETELELPEAVQARRDAALDADLLEDDERLLVQAPRLVALAELEVDEAEVVERGADHEAVAGLLRVGHRLTVVGLGLVVGLHVGGDVAQRVVGARHRRVVVELHEDRESLLGRLLALGELAAAREPQAQAEQALGEAGLVAEAARQLHALLGAAAGGVVVPGGERHVAEAVVRFGHALDVLELAREREAQLVAAARVGVGAQARLGLAELADHGDAQGGVGGLALGRQLAQSALEGLLGLLIRADPQRLRPGALEELGGLARLAGLLVVVGDQARVLAHARAALGHEPIGRLGVQLQPRLLEDAFVRHVAQEGVLEDVFLRADERGGVPAEDHLLAAQGVEHAVLAVGRGGGVAEPVDRAVPEDAADDGRALERLALAGGQAVEA